ncbi:DNA-binding protein [Lysobacter soli]|uniref:DNA-binding protein n=1 Tax=Lysobacter soli TaxID=453783 RepID=UPI0020A11C2D|nr:DNA-binding protein [Lysobacter soli]UTA53163.1 DNA-binding protein [Lysobacter soli]
MAKGITENDVHAAADAILAGGNRPTVERIRAHLGTGSPNTVTRWLETWWRAIGGRLAAQQERLTWPEAPSDVAAAASRLWELALLRADAYAEARLADERMALQGAYSAIAEREALAQMQVQAAFEEQAQAREALKASEMRLGDLQRLLEQQAAQIQDIQRERGQGQVRVSDLTAELARVRAQGDAAATAFATERDMLLQQLRGSEERAAMEIDRARQTSKRLQTEAKARAGQQQADLADARQNNDLLVRELQATRREGDVQRARADALEQQLGRFAELPAQLEATLSRVQANTAVTLAAPRSRGKRGAGKKADARHP